MGDDMSTVGRTTRGRVLATQCMAPLRAISDEEGWVHPIDIQTIQDMLALTLDALLQVRGGLPVREPADAD